MDELPATFSAWMRRSIRRALLLVGLLGLFLCALVALHNKTLEQTRGQERYSFDFADIDCPAPEGSERADFLAEVQYLSGLPTRMDCLDPQLLPILAKAFGRHPRVERVEQVDVSPPKQVHVRLAFRAVPAATNLNNLDKTGRQSP